MIDDYDNEIRCGGMGYENAWYSMLHEINDGGILSLGFGLALCLFLTVISAWNVT